MGKLVDMIGAEKGREAISYEQWLFESIDGIIFAYQTLTSIAQGGAYLESVCPGY